MVIEVVPTPPSLSAEIVYVVVAETPVGVPEIAPVVVLNINPDGKAGPIDQLVDEPPVLVGVQVVMAEPTIKLLDDGV